jgi:protein gp37
MAESSAIEWTDATVNFWWGCTKVGPGCDHCYAETWNKFRGNGLWGAGAPRRLIKSAKSTIRKLNRDHDRFVAEHGRRRRVFIQSMSDTFDNEVDQSWRGDAFSEIETAPNLDIQLLTKRLPNVPKMIPAHWRAGYWPRHVGLMITVVNQEEADRDVPRLIEMKSLYNIPWIGLSCEPLLEPLDLRQWLYDYGCGCGWGGDSPADYCNGCGWVGHAPGEIGEARCLECREMISDYNACPDCGANDGGQTSFGPNNTWLDWIIVGGESGRHARQTDADAIRTIRDQCAATGTPFLFKQWGEYVPTSDANGPYMMWAGKKAAGRLLDGRTHDEFPRVAA